MAPSIVLMRGYHGIHRENTPPVKSTGRDASSMWVTRRSPSWAVGQHPPASRPRTADLDPSSGKAGGGIGDEDGDPRRALDTLILEAELARLGTRRTGSRRRSCPPSSRGIARRAALAMPGRVHLGPGSEGLQGGEPRKWTTFFLRRRSAAVATRVIRFRFARKAITLNRARRRESGALVCCCRPAHFCPPTGSEPPASDGPMQQELFSRSYYPLLRTINPRQVF